MPIDSEQFATLVRILRRVPLRRRDGSVSGFALLDRSDYGIVAPHNWYEDSDGYPVRNTGRDLFGKQEKIRMGRLIMGLTKGDPRQVDHVDGNKLNHTRSNLRVVTNKQNMQNRRSHKEMRGNPVSSGYRGVSWNKASQKWKAGVTLDGKMHHIGYFDDEVEAARAARALRVELMQYTYEVPCV